MISILLALTICSPLTSPMEWARRKFEDSDSIDHYSQNTHHELKSKALRECHELVDIGVRVACEKDQFAIKGSSEEAESVARSLSYNYAKKFISSKYLLKTNGFQSISRSLRAYSDSGTYVTIFNNRFDLIFKLGLQDRPHVLEELMTQAIQIEAHSADNNNFLTSISTTDILIQDTYISEVCKKSKKAKECLQKLYEFHLRFSSDRNNKKGMIVESFAIQLYYFHQAKMNPLQLLFKDEINVHEWVLLVRNKLLFHKEPLKQPISSVVTKIAYRLNREVD